LVPTRRVSMRRGGRPAKGKGLRTTVRTRSATSDFLLPPGRGAGPPSIVSIAAPGGRGAGNVLVANIPFIPLLRPVRNIRLGEPEILAHRALKRRVGALRADMQRRLQDHTQRALAVGECEERDQRSPSQAGKVEGPGRETAPPSEKVNDNQSSATQPEDRRAHDPILLQAPDGEFHARQRVILEVDELRNETALHPAPRGPQEMSPDPRGRAPVNVTVQLRDRETPIVEYRFGQEPLPEVAIQQYGSPTPVECGPETLEAVDPDRRTRLSRRHRDETIDRLVTENAS